MPLEQLLKLENITDYYILWYGANIIDSYFYKNGFVKDTIELTKYKPNDDNTLYIFLSGINRQTCKYKCAAKLHPTNKEPFYSFERVNIALDDYA